MEATTHIQHVAYVMEVEHMEQLQLHVVIAVGQETSQLPVQVLLCSLYRVYMSHVAHVGLRHVLSV